LLPTALLQQVWLCGGWGIVTAWLAVWLLQRVNGRIGVLRLTALGSMAWACVPGEWSVAYWLGLAFQSPSVVAVAWSGWFLVQRLLPSAPQVAEHPTLHGWKVIFAGVGVVLGWALMLDTLALLPITLYAWGWMPAVVGVAVFAATLPWLTQWRGVHVAAAPWLLGVAVAIFVVFRLPTGNLWDALLDPWLWLLLHGVAFRAVRAHFQR
jgi:hypothetical protein